MHSQVSGEACCRWCQLRCSSIAPQGHRSLFWRCIGSYQCSGGQCATDCVGWDYKFPELTFRWHHVSSNCLFLQSPKNQNHVVFKKNWQALQAWLQDTQTTWRLKLSTKSTWCGLLGREYLMLKLQATTAFARPMRCSGNTLWRWELFPNMRGASCLTIYSITLIMFKGLIYSSQQCE